MFGHAGQPLVDEIALAANLLGSGFGDHVSGETNRFLTGLARFVVHACERVGEGRRNRAGYFSLKDGRVDCGRRGCDFGRWHRRAAAQHQHRDHDSQDDDENGQDDVHDG